jgi:hypothetical protein
MQPQTDGEAYSAVSQTRGSSTPYAHYPEALIYQTSDSLNRILGRKGLP